MPSEDGYGLRRLRAPFYFISFHFILFYFIFPGTATRTRPLNVRFISSTLLKNALVCDVNLGNSIQRVNLEKVIRKLRGFGCKSE